jgi:hypothetical protein
MAAACSTRLEGVSPLRRQSAWRTAATLAMAVALQFGVRALAKADDPHLGIIEYEISCMPCHGVDGHGDGRRAQSLKTAPADLTKIAKSNNGEFPSQKIAEIIDGRAIVASHGRREMPVWGDRYRMRTEANETPAEIDKRARSQIEALVRYLKTIQEK